MVKDAFWPKNLSEALQIRAQQQVTPCAGNTDLMMVQNQELPLLFIGKLPELKKIYEDDQWIHVGAAVTFTEGIASPLIPEVMKQALRGIAAPAIRNAATFGGNFSNGSAVADSALVAWAVHGKVKLASVKGERILSMEEYILDRRKLALRDDELLTEVLFPAKGLERFYYRKVGGRAAQAISYVAFAGIWELKENRIERISFAIGAVTPKVLVWRDIEARLTGKTLQEAAAMKPEILALCSERLVLPEQRVSAAYGKQVCLNLLNDFFEQIGF